MNPPTISPPPSVPAPKGRGCFFYGCLTAICLFVLFLLLAVMTVRMVKHKIADYTEAKPMPMPKVEMTDAELKELQGRVKGLGEALDQGKAAEPLVLSERDLNALITNSDQTKQLADVVRVHLDGDQVKGRVSIPLSRLGWFGRGRYLNGEATFHVSLQNGVLIVTAEEVRVHDQPLPESFMGALRQQNLAKEVYKDAKNAEALRKLESIQVKDGQVTIQPRAQP